MVQASVQRRAVRRAVRTECQAVQLHAFRLFGERAVDLSPLGMLVHCDHDTQLGDDVVISFKAPGPDAPWLEAEAEVARLVQGFRAGDRGLCAGLRFRYFEKSSRHELLARLAGFPPPLPQRRLLTARERMAAMRRDVRTPHTATDETVVIRPIVTLWDEPVFPLVRVRSAAPARRDAS